MPVELPARMQMHLVKRAALRYLFVRFGGQRGTVTWQS